MKLWEQQEGESNWDWLSDMASLVLVILFCAVASLALLAIGWAVTK